MTDILPWDNPDSLPTLNGAAGRGKCKRHEWPRDFHGAPWPATCGRCMLTTEDPDGYFWPKDADTEVLPAEYICQDGQVHEAMFRCLNCRAVQAPGQQP